MKVDFHSTHSIISHNFYKIIGWLFESWRKWRWVTFSAEKQKEPKRGLFRLLPLQDKFRTLNWKKIKS